MSTSILLIIAFISPILAIPMRPASESLVTDFQQIDTNILDNAYVWFMNKLDGDTALEFAGIVDSEFASGKELATTLQDWITTQNATTGETFNRWIEDLKRQSSLAKQTFIKLSRRFDPEAVAAFRHALKAYYRTDISQTEQNHIYNTIRNGMPPFLQHQLDMLFSQVYERATFHFLTPHLDYDRYLELMTMNAKRK
uniref:DUF148 domain-containing protein n=1 Tax=Panagrellus redivivus TaxID=6233 RepID=A0A7E4ZST2_PANRE